MTRNNDDLRKDAAEALCCLAHALGEEFTIFIPSTHKLLVKHHLRVSFFVFMNVPFLMAWSNFFTFSFLTVQKMGWDWKSITKARAIHFWELVSTQYTQCPPDVISDPLDDFDSVPSEEADETQRQLRSHQVICFVVLKPLRCYIFPLLYSASY